MSKATGLFVKKSIKTLLSEAQNRDGGMKRSIGIMTLLALGIGAIVGAGIFTLTGPAAAQYAGPGIILSLVVAAIVCAFAALCYAEFASLIPVSGSAYTYAYATMGEFTAWIIGWGLTLEFIFSPCTVAVSWSAYLGSLLSDMGLVIPQALSAAPFDYSLSTGWSATGSLINLPAVLIILLIGALISVGVKAAASFNNVMVVVKVVAIVLFVVCGIAYIKLDNLTPLIPANTGSFGEFGFSGILRGASVVFFAFLGFEALATMAQECKNPQKHLPMGMIGSLGISTVIYIFIAIVLVGVVSYTTLNVADPISVAVQAMGSKFIWLRIVMKLAILSGLTSVILVMMMGQSRIFYIIARDGLLPPSLGKLHGRFKTPFNATLLVTLICVLMGGLFPVAILGQLTSMGALLAFTIVCFGILVLRYKQPTLHRPFKTPFVPWVPLAGTLVCLLLMLAMPAVTWSQFLLWMALGCAIYFSYGIKHSKVRLALAGKK
jgi:APA family basic amino acid/polyamine antiporter